MQVEVTDADRELFITLSNADGQMAERILCGEAFTWEVEQIARHRHQARAEVVGEIVAELRELHWTHRDAEPAKRLAGMIEAKFGGRDAD